MSGYKGFTTVMLRRPERSLFDLGHEKRLSTVFGKLTPILMQEAIPNDTFRCKTEMLVRLAPTIAPIMHRINAFIHYFFVPNRLLMEDWEPFITAGRLGDQEPIPPRFLISDIVENISNGTLADYLGIDPEQISAGGWTTETLDAMPFAAYWRCWYDYYRDRNFVGDSEILPMPSGTLNYVDYADLIQIKRRAFQHDYFTSALPFTQRGAEVLMPLSGSGSVTYYEQSNLEYSTNSPVVSATSINSDGFGGLTSTSAGAGTVPSRIENIDEVLIENSNVLINDLRQAVRLQEWMERNALAGSRYNESIMAHFGRRTSDSRLQRAEFLGGGKVTLKINEVVNTAWSTDASDNNVPAGTMSGHGIAYTDQPSFTYNCEEHGFIVGILSIMPVTAYSQGLPRYFKRPTFLDYPWPSFAHLGEQPVYDWEIFSDGASLQEDETGSYPVFGYQSRYADWKHALSSCHGDFRTSLDFWHLTRKFSSAPVLSANFNTLDPVDFNRIFAVETGDKFWIYMYHNLTVKRALPYYGTPAL